MRRPVETSSESPDSYESSEAPESSNGALLITAGLAGVGGVFILVITLGVFACRKKKQGENGGKNESPEHVAMETQEGNEYYDSDKAPDAEFSLNIENHNEYYE